MENFKKTKSDFEIKKTQYFSRLALRVSSAFALHKNEGKGSAMRHGFRAAANEIIVFLDADILG